MGGSTTSSSRSTGTSLRSRPSTARLASAAYSSVTQRSWGAYLLTTTIALSAVWMPSSIRPIVDSPDSTSHSYRNTRI
jgi:hypothetical protein